jgi:hypothetical protein
VPNQICPICLPILIIFVAYILSIDNYPLLNTCATQSTRFELPTLHLTLNYIFVELFIIECTDVFLTKFKYIHIGCSFKCGRRRVDCKHTTDYKLTEQLFKFNLTFCVVCVFTLQIDEWCVHNRLFNANFEDKFK